MAFISNNNMKTYKIIEDGYEYDITEYKDGDKVYRLNRLYHRENGPYLENTNGFKVWAKNGMWSRLDGPARIFPDGRSDYWLNDEFFPEITSDEEWIEFQKELIIKEIIE
jgi:hypothetical protein